MVGSRKEGIPLDEIEGLMEVLGKINQIDLGKIEIEKEAKLTPQEKMIRDLKANRHIKRMLKGKGRYKANLHWKTKAARNRKYWNEIGNPRRRARIAETLNTGEGWYKYLVDRWRIHRTEVRLTQDEWLSEIYPLLEGRVPIFRRYDTRKPVALDNVLVRDQDTGSVIFDGAEYRLRKLGYCL